MISYDVVFSDVESKLSEYRFRHSRAVVKRALEYAKIYNVDKEIVKLVAIAHDVAKELSDEEIDKYIKMYDIKLDEIEKLNSNLLHAKIGACICKDKYQFSDDMVNAVKYHTTGRENMSILEKIIYLADATEENKEYCSASYTDMIKKDINVGMVEISRWVINKLLDKEKLIHLDTIKCYNYYFKITKLKNMEN